ncbi:pyridoxal-phosphate dependent enzyme, partial [Streptomyces sp. NPDC006393]|uniref:pyridoxal-phosphate dependent enzyme n=1 Tax=Streptomyces sp. NPDC006393 TaxID=3156763 RepID=UPI0033C65869
PIVQNKVIKNPETVATAIRIGNPASWEKATNALKESNGLIDSVTDEEILEAYQMMTSKEGVFSEPASNASIAGLIKLKRAGRLPQGKKPPGISGRGHRRKGRGAVFLCGSAAWARPATGRPAPAGRRTTPSS